LVLKQGIDFELVKSAISIEEKDLDTADGVAPTLL